MFVAVTSAGFLFNRTDGVNNSIVFGKPYYLSGDKLIFDRNGNKGFSVSRYDAEDNLILNKSFSDPGSYMIAKVFIQKLPNISREVRTLYNTIRDIIDKAHFKIKVDNEIESDYTIKLHSWVENGRFGYRYSIKFAQEKPSMELIEEVYGIMVRAAKIDVRSVLSHHGSVGMSADVTDNFIETCEMIAEFQEKLSSNMDIKIS